MGQPEAYVHYAPDLIAADGTITVESTRKFLQEWLVAFRTHIERNTHTN